MVDADQVIRLEWGQGAVGTPRGDPPPLAEFQRASKWIPADELDPHSLPFPLPPGPPPARAWKHPRIFFPSYAYEWSPGMAQAAARLVLELNLDLLASGWELKDATPSNVLFQGPRPIYVDHLSPALRRPGQLGWVAYGQFVRTFLIPLILNRLRGLPLAWIYLAQRDGIPPEKAIQSLSWFDRIRPSLFTLITMPSIFARRTSQKPWNDLPIWKSGEVEPARQITSRILQGLGRNLNRWAKQKDPASYWARYGRGSESYSEEGLQVKEAIVGEMIHRLGPRSVLDLGCNTGRFSLLAAQAGARVVACDSDPSCVERLWRKAGEQDADILPLVIDVARPSPAFGWENREEMPFLERVEGRFDLVLSLALLHHLLVRERIPLPRIVDFLARTTTRCLVVEWVPPEDPQFKRLAGPRIEDYLFLTRPVAEAAFLVRFEIMEVREVPGGGRLIYILKKRMADDILGSGF